MLRPLRALFVEDCAVDAELQLLALRNAGYAPEWRRVETESEYRAHLHPGLDLILADYALPQFSGPRALAILRELRLDIPFILVSGVIGEETAVEAMKQGAADYLFKDRMARLGPAVRQALAQAKLRRERTAAEDSLKLFRALVDHSNDTVEVIDPRTARFLDINERGCAQLGYSREELLSLRVFDVSPDSNESTWPQEVEALRLHGSLSRRALRRRKDGSAFPVEINAKWVRLDRDYLVAVVRDITDRTRADEALEESERRFREMLENVELIAITLDQMGKLTFCNDYLLKTTGWTRGELLGSDWFSILTPGDRKVKDLFFDSIAAGKVPAQYEGPIMTKRGARREIAWNNTMLRDSTGSVVGIAAIGEDVTERKQADERILEQAAMLNQTHEAILVRDIRSRQITFWNKGAERLYGWTAAEAVGRDVGELIFVDPSAPTAVTEQLLRTGEWHGERKQVTKSGRQMTVSGHVTLVRDTQGEPISALAINIDVTPQKNLEAQLRIAQRNESVGALASGVAHVLNNVLSPILLRAPALRGELTAHEREEIISAIEASAERGAQIVKQVLASGGGVEGEQRPLRVEFLVEEVVKIMRETFPRNIAIESRIEGRLWPVVGDAAQIRQALLNLCLNARDAMPNGGRLSLRLVHLELDANYASMLPAAVAGPHLLIEIGDSGCGMTPEIAERIFEPFFTTNASGQGAGLGLSTTLGIVKSHGGVINVITQPGAGSTFQVYLPAAPNCNTAPEISAPSDPCRGNDELILLVDDEECVLNATSIALESSGYRVLRARNGVEALAAFALNSSHVGAVITDLMMPMLDGAALARALRTMAPALPIIASTGLGGRAKITDLAALNLTGFLTKPYGADTLRRTVHEALHPAGAPASPS